MSASVERERHVEALRDQLTLRVSRAVFLLGALVFPLTWIAFATDPVGRAVPRILAALLAAIFWAGFLPAPPRARRIVLETSLGILVVVTSIVGGLLPGTVAGAAAVSLLAAFLAPSRTGLLATAGMGAWLLAAGWLRVGPLSAYRTVGPSADLSLASNWLRTGISSATFAVVPVVAMIEYLRSLSQVLAAERTALDGVRQEETRRKAAAEASSRADAERRRLQGLEALGKVGGGFAHELSNRLMVIRAELDALAWRKDMAPASIVRGAVADMIEAFEGGSVALRRLLALSARDVPQANDSVDLAEVLRIAQRQLSGIRGLAVAVEVQKSPRALADLPALHGVLLNLALNARDAMGGGGTLRLRARPATDAERASTGCAAAIDVIDAGSGMDEAVLARLFEPFFTTKGAHGTGLGLHAARRAVELAGGSLRVESTPGRGTTFTVLLREAPPVAPREERPRAHPAPSEGIPVLLVDDDAAVRRAWGYALSGQGLRVFEAADVDEAIAIAQKERIVLAWMDGVMPGRPTRDLVAELRRIQPHARLVICSGHVEEDLLRRDLLLGATEFVPKPCSPRELIDRALSDASVE